MNALLKILQSKSGVLGLCVLLLLASIGTYFVMLSGPSIPVISLEGLDKEVADAIMEAHAALAQAPRSADSWGHLGRVLMANEIHPDIALGCFLEAERLDPQNPRWPYFIAGDLSVNKGKPDEALPKIQRSVALSEHSNPAPSAPRLLLAETLVMVGKSEEAAAQFNHVLSMEPNNSRAHFGLGLLAYSRGDWQGCRTHLEACMGSPQARKKAAVHLATVYERLEDKASAEKYANLVGRLPKDLDWIDPYVSEHAHLAVRKRDKYRLVENLEGQRKFGDAAAILTRLVADDPEDYLPHLMMGRILPQMVGQLHSAEQHLLKAKRLAPDKIQVHYLLSLVYYYQGEALWRAPNGDRVKATALFEESVKSARHALALRSDYGYAHMALGLALKHLGQREESLTAFREAVHCSPEKADNHLFLGQSLAEQGNIAEARYYLEQAQLLAEPGDSRPKAALDKLPAKKTPK